MNIFLIWAISYVVAFVLCCVFQAIIYGNITVKDIFIFFFFSLFGPVSIFLAIFAFVLATPNISGFVIYRKKQKKD